jgi:hypothetical protein
MIAKYHAYKMLLVFTNYYLVETMCRYIFGKGTSKRR